MLNQIRLMGNCVGKKGKATSPHVTLAILGLDNAGKTVTTRGLQGETLDTVAPTVGFSSVDFRFEKNNITLFDLGGGKKIRDIWKNYFSEVYGVIYVIDSSEPERLEECASVLKGLIEHPKVAGKPLLVLANKQDVKGAMDDSDILEGLNLEELVNTHKCPCKLEMCSAVVGQGKKLDRSIRQGMQWMLGMINEDWDDMNIRVQQDVTEQQEREKQDKRERVERVRNIRDERERKEKEERLARGEPEEDEEEEQNDQNGQNPFKRVNVHHLHKKRLTLLSIQNIVHTVNVVTIEKDSPGHFSTQHVASNAIDQQPMEQHLKEEKERKKRTEGNGGDEEDALHSSSKSSRRQRRRLSGAESNNGGDTLPQQQQQQADSTQIPSMKSNSTRASIQGPPPGTPCSQEVCIVKDIHVLSSRSTGRKPSSTSSTSRSSRHEGRLPPLSHSAAQQEISPSDEEEELWGLGSRSQHRRFSYNTTGASLDLDSVSANKRGSVLGHVGNLVPLEDLADSSSKKKKKKKKARKNQTMPADGVEGGKEDGTPGGWPSGSQHSRSSRITDSNTTHEHHEEEDLSSKWGLLNDDLGDDDMPASSGRRKGGPNAESDSEIVT